MEIFLRCDDNETNKHAIISYVKSPTKIPHILVAYCGAAGEYYTKKMIVPWHLNQILLDV